VLTPAQQRVCQMLGDGALSVKEAAEELRIPRATLYDEIRRIRWIFDAQGLEKYFKD
jgi:RNA polymerase sigma-70 factor (ECF subfamily)